MEQQPTMSETDRFEKNHKIVLWAYIAWCTAPITGGIGPVVAIVMAYIIKKDVLGTYLQSHVQNITSTFWTSLVLGIILGLFMVGGSIVFLGLGILGGFLFFGLAAWVIYRLVRGLITLNRREDFPRRRADYAPAADI